MMRRREIVALLSLAWPIALTQVGLVSLGLVDVAVLGRLSVTDLAGSSIGRSIGFVGVGIPMGVAAALEPIASQAVGAGEPRRAWAGLRAALPGCALAWAPCMLVALVATRFLEPLGIETAVADRARAFLVGHAPGLLFFSWFLAQKAYLQAHGRTAPLVLAAVVANLVNWIVCNVLVRGDGFLAALGLPRAGLAPMGAVGAGIASSIACFVLVVATAPFVRMVEREQSGDVGAPVRVTRLLSLGAPIGLQLVAEIGVFAAVALAAGRMGPTVMAAHQVAIGLASFTFMGVLGLSGATSVRVGHAVGEGRPARARSTGFLGIGLGALYMLVCGVVFAIVPAPLVRLFTVDPDVVALGSDLVRVAALFQVVDGVQGVAAGALRGAGDVRQPFVANVVGHWIIGLPVAVLLGGPGRMGARGLWLGLTLGLAAVAVALVVRFAVVSRTAVRRI